MLALSRRSVLALAAVVDIALNARPAPVSAKALAARHELPPRHLEPLLQALVRAGILKGLRGPRGGYELARERRRITAGEVVRLAASLAEEGAALPEPRSPLVGGVIDPTVARASEAFFATLDGVTLDDLCREAEARRLGTAAAGVDFTI